MLKDDDKDIEALLCETPWSAILVPLAVGILVIVLTLTATVMMK